MRARALTLRDLLESLGCAPAEQLVEVEVGKRWAWGPAHERARPLYIAVSAKLEADRGTEITIRITGVPWEEEDEL
jgi:hypothetical protein